jgi:hypothetical protein
MKTSKTRTQITDISVAGRELNEEHLRFVAGGTVPTRYTTYGVTYTRTACNRDAVDSWGDVWT